jgi:hypothetical protein
LGVDAQLLGHGGVGTVARVAPSPRLTVASVRRAAVVGAPRTMTRRC